MKVAVLVHAFKNPEQVHRLVEKLVHTDVDIYLHVDKKVPLEPFLFATPNLFHIKSRENVYWGGFSQVIATLNSLKQIMASSIPYSHVVFISGQDYPLMPIGNIIDELKASPGKEFIRCKEISIKEWQVGYRYQKFRFRYKVFDLVSRILPYRRGYPLEKVYGGSQWWNLSVECISYILQFCESHKSFINFHRFVHCSDEIFFQSIVMNSPFAEKVINDSMRFIDWSEHEKHPKILAKSDYQPMVESGKWFGRKFDVGVDGMILMMLDEYLEQKNVDQIHN